MHEHLEKWKTPQLIGTAGFVRLVDVMGEDSSIVQAARVSYGDGTKTVSDDEQLIRYLMRHRHSTPQEMCQIKLHIRIPMDAWRQFVRHRTLSINEVSTRYSVATEDTAVTNHKEWRLQSKDNKQGSQGFLGHWELDEHGVPISINSDFDSASFTTPGHYLTYREQELQHQAREIYNERIKLGVAREQARKDLPLSTYTEAYVCVDLHNLFHFLGLRLHPHAQQEIREFAEAIFRIVQDWVPLAAKAFEDYRLNACSFSAEEMKILRHILANHTSMVEDQEYPHCTFPEMNKEFRKDFFDQFNLTTRERAEFWNKVTE